MSNYFKHKKTIFKHYNSDMFNQPSYIQLLFKYALIIDAGDSQAISITLKGLREQLWASLIEKVILCNVIQKSVNHHVIEALSLVLIPDEVFKKLYHLALEGLTMNIFKWVGLNGSFLSGPYLPFFALCHTRRRGPQTLHCKV